MAKKFNIKVVSPNFKLEYGLNDKDIEIRLNKLIKISEARNDPKTLYIWPEGVFSGYSFDELNLFKNIYVDWFICNYRAFAFR